MMLYPDTIDWLIPISRDDAISGTTMLTAVCQHSRIAPVIISSMADSHILCIIFAICGHTETEDHYHRLRLLVCVWCSVSAMNLQWSSRLLDWRPPLLITGTPNPLRPAICRTCSKNWLYWCFDTPDCNSVVLLSVKREREISFKICYSLVNVLLFFVLKKKKKKNFETSVLMCHATLATHVKIRMCVCGWWTESNQETFSHIWVKIKLQQSWYP